MNEETTCENCEELNNTIEGLNDVIEKKDDRITELEQLVDDTKGTLSEISSLVESALRQF